MKSEKKFTLLSEIGEFGVINILTKNNKIKNTSTIKAVGDDAAVINYKNDYFTLLSTDMLIENIHFNLVYTPLKYLGFKSVSVNVSDIYAMNGKPEQIVVSVAVSNRFTLEAMKELYEGIYEACQFYNVDLIGGDTTTIPKGLVISITVVGKAKQDQIVYRNGAQADDLICVSGDLGAAYAGLQLLEREKRVYQNQPNAIPDWTGWEYILERQLKPVARRDIIEIFHKKQIKPNSMIDISDGLSSEIIHICTQSNTGAEIYEERLPIEQQTRMMMEQLNIHPTIAAMNGGEDYELLFTIPLKEFSKIKDNPAITVIGKITDKPAEINLITTDGAKVPITAQGWNAFEEERK